MAAVDRRVRVWSWLVRRQGSIASLDEAGVLAVQARHTPDNALTNRIFGAVAPGTVVNDRTIKGPGGDLPLRVYRPSRAGSGARPLIVNFHGGGFVFGDLRLADWACSRVAVTAEEAEKVGMVNRVVPLADLQTATMELARQIAQMHPFALRQAKRAVNQTLDVQGFYAAIQSVFDIHQTGHGNALSVSGYAILTRLAEMKERIKTQ